MLNPLRVRGFLMYLPQFVRLFYRLMKDQRVSIIAKAVPFVALILLLSPPALELDLIPILGELDWILVGFIALKVFIWLCPPEVVREHVTRIAQGA